jgi:hypothetical protein
MIAFCLQGMWERRIELLGYCIGEGRCCSTLAILSGSLGIIGEFSVTVYCYWSTRTGYWGCAVARLRRMFYVK